MKRLIACAALLLLASGCEQLQPMLAHAGYIHDLGDFKIERVSFVQSMPGPGDGYDGGGHLKIDLASKSRLSLGYPTYWIGVDADYCPLTGDRLIGFGYYGDGLDFDASRDEQWGKPSAGILPRFAASVAAPAPRARLVKPSADGLYRYVIYVVRAYPPPGKTRDDYGGPKTGPNAQYQYDIIADKKDICLQFFGGDHYNVFARSSDIRVTYGAIRRAAIEAGTIKKP